MAQLESHSSNGRLLDTVGLDGSSISKGQKQGSIPAKLAPILQQLQINADNWMETIREFDPISLMWWDALSRCPKPPSAWAAAGLAGFLNASRAFD